MQWDRHRWLWRWDAEQLWRVGVGHDEIEVEDKENFTFRCRRHETNLRLLFSFSCTELESISWFWGWLTKCLMEASVAKTRKSSWHIHIRSSLILTSYGHSVIRWVWLWTCKKYYSKSISSCRGGRQKWMKSTCKPTTVVKHAFRAIRRKVWKLGGSQTKLYCNMNNLRQKKNPTCRSVVCTMYIPEVTRLRIPMYTR